jgi:hypothetical protein
MVKRHRALIGSTRTGESLCFGKKRTPDILWTREIVLKVSGTLRTEISRFSQALRLPDAFFNRLLGDGKTRRLLAGLYWVTVGCQEKRLSFLLLLHSQRQRLPIRIRGQDS